MNQIIHKKLLHKHINFIGKNIFFSKFIDEIYFMIGRINPLAIESETLLLGSYTLANEWQDGILTTMLRKANRVRIFR